MAEYRGINGVARRISKEYRGVNGVARKIVKAYRGINNVARKYFPSVVYLYDSGDLCSSFTGGWSYKTGNSVAIGSTGWTGVPTMTKASDHLLMYMKDLPPGNASSDNYTGTWYTSNAINLSGYKKLRMVCDIQLGSAYSANRTLDDNLADHVRIGPSRSTYTNDEYIITDIITFSNWASNGEKILEVDISSLTGNYYIIVEMGRFRENLTNGDDSVTLKIKEVYLS